MTTRRRAPWAIYGMLLVLFAIAASLAAVNASFDVAVAVSVLMMLSYGTVGALLASRGKGGPLGWLMLTLGIGFALTGLSAELATYASRQPGPSTLGLDLAAWLSNWIFFLVITSIILILLLFPTGSPPSARWRPVVWATIGFAAAGILASILRPGPIEVAVVANPTGIEALDVPTRVTQVVVAMGMLAASVASAIGLIVRFRRARGDERQQIRWLAYLAAVAILLLVGLLLTGLAAGPSRSSPLNDAFWLAMLVCIGVAFPVAIGISIFRYRLYDLDLVVKKTVLYATVAAILVALFLVVAIVVGGLAGRSQTGAIVAAAAIGVAFWPAVRLARRVADRVVYGGRATPYEVLTDFSHRVAGSYAAEDVLPRMARILADAVGARDATVWLRVGDELRPAGIASSAGVVPVPAALVGDELPRLETDATVEVRDQGELLGALTATMPPNDPMSPSKERLVKDLAAQAGLVLRNVRLIEELRASRQRLVAAQDEGRRRLERNIHDGAQQQLVALTVKLRLLGQIAERDPAKAREMAEQIQADATSALDDLRDLARGIYPPLLADEGLPSALVAQARKSSLPIRVDAQDVGRFSQDVEAAIYFSCLEALQNVAKYAEASQVTISLARHDGLLSFAIADDGVGFDPTAVSRGSGLQGIADRLDALGGTLDVVSTIGTGTIVNGSVPVH